MKTTSTNKLLVFYFHLSRFLFSLIPARARMEAGVFEELRGKPDSEVVSDFEALNNSQLTKKDIFTLKGTTWVNDEVVNCYCSLINRASFLASTDPRDSESIHVLCFSTFFVTRYMDPPTNTTSYGAVKKWNKKDGDFSLYEILIFPVHADNNHWICILVDIAAKKVSTYDSLRGGETNVKYTDSVVDFLSSRDTRREIKIGAESFDRVDVGVPQQDNYHDCGVFVCQYIKYVSQGKRPNFEQEDLPALREVMARELISKQLSNSVM
jgi:sentrin-specific protease 1